jgi:hypothetical protein
MTVTLVRLGDQRFFIASRDVPLGCHLAHEPPAFWSVDQCHTSGLCVRIRNRRSGSAGCPDRPPLVRIVRHRKRAAPPDKAAEELTPVMARLEAADLSTLDTLINAGIANSRAEALRWAVGRIRAHPAYAQLQQRVHEIDELKAQF